MIYLISGPIQSGKTTTLSQWAAGRHDVGGFLSPVVDGRRVLSRLIQEEVVEFEINNDEYNDEIVTIGRYDFAKKGFDKAISWVQQDLRNEDLNYLIIDEIGKLEMRDQGFSNLFMDILQSRCTDISVIIVVRDSLIQDVIKKFGLTTFTILEDNNIISEILDAEN